MLTKSLTKPQFPIIMEIGGELLVARPCDGGWSFRQELTIEIDGQLKRIEVEVDLFCHEPHG